MATTMMVGHVQTSQDAMEQAVAFVREACSQANGIAPGEALVVLELAWQREAQERRAAALLHGGLEEERTHQLGRLGMLETLVTDDGADRYDGTRWLGHSATALQAVALCGSPIGHA